MKLKITSYDLFFTIFLSLFFCFPKTIPADTYPNYIRAASIKAGHPTAIAVDGSGNLYIAETNKNHILIYDGSGRYSKRLSGLDKPISIAVDKEGRIYIGNAGMGSVDVFDADLTLLFKLGLGDMEFKRPAAIAVDSTGKIYVADDRENQIKVYNSDGSTGFAFGVSGSGDGEFNSPTAITIDENAGEIIVSDLQVQTVKSQSIGAGRIQFFSLSGDFIGSFGDFGVGEGFLNKPLGLDVDNEGRIYVADAYQNVVQIFDHSGNPLAILYNPDYPLRNPLAIAIDRNTNRLFVASLNTSSIEVYKESGDNIPPSAEAGPDQEVDEGDAVLLNGVHSKDLDDGIASYCWEQTGGTQVALSDSNSPLVRFKTPDVGQSGDILTFQLKIKDYMDFQSTDTCSIHVAWVNAPPIVDIGPDQSVEEGDSVQLDGSSSNDPDDGIASYEWDQIQGTEVILSGIDSMQASFTAPDVEPEGETLIFRLRITDNSGLQSTNLALVNVTWVNDSPEANAGPDQTVVAGDMVFLNGSSSSDPDDGIDSYLWEQIEPEEGIQVDISGSKSMQASFTAPDAGQEGETLVFRLTVTDKGSLQSRDTCIVNIIGTVVGGNSPPTAKAGPDQTVKEGDGVELDGRDSKDPDDDIVSYLWEQTDGTEVALTDSNSVLASFYAPDVGQGGEALIFQLTVTDNNSWQSSDTCIVNVTWENLPPTAKASGTSQPVSEGSTVTLDYSGSSDPDDGIASWVWIQTKGKPVTLSDSSASQPTFVCPPVGVGGAELTFQLKVTDIAGLQDTDEISITIDDNGITGFPDDVITCESTTGRHIGIKETGNGNITRLNAVDPETITTPENRPQDMIYGLFDLEIRVPNAGGMARITFYLPDPASKEHKWVRHIPSKGWIDFSRDVISKGKGDGAEFNTNRNEVTLYITDNGDYDDDPRSGIIRDPSGLGIPSGGGGGTSSSIYTGGGGGGGGCFIATAASEADTEPACQFEINNGHAPSTPKKDAPLSKDEQQKRSVEAFRRIFEISRLNDRPAHLKQMMDLYYQIIEHYPDVPLAQESYWRLIEICFKDFQPPKKDKALSLYKEFQGRYPDSPLKNVVEVTMRRLLYLNGYWHDLLAFTSPVQEDFSNPKGSRSPLPMFFYSEAKFHLNDFKEASRGYRAILEYFPDSRMAMTARKRMDEIKKGN